MPIERGATLLTWSFAEYPRYERGRRWYTGAAVVALALLAYAFATRNFLFVVILVMVAVVLALRHAREPTALSCAFTERGILIGDRYDPYDAFREFWIVDDAGPWGTLYVQSNGTRPRIAVPLEDRDADRIRSVLRAHLTERADGDEPGSDLLARWLKL